MLLAACGGPSPTTTAPGADLAAPAGVDLAAAADLALRDGGLAPGGDGGACPGAPTPPTTLYLDYCMDAPSSFCFRDAPPSGFF